MATGQAVDGTRWQVQVGVEPDGRDSTAGSESRQLVTIEVVRLGSAG